MIIEDGGERCKTIGKKTTMTATQNNFSEIVRGIFDGWKYLLVKSTASPNES